MTLENQKTLLKKLNAALHKETLKHERDGNTESAQESESEADGIVEVIKTVEAAIKIRDGLSILSNT